MKKLLILSLFLVINSAEAMQWRSWLGSTTLAKNFYSGALSCGSHFKRSLFSARSPKPVTYGRMRSTMYRVQNNNEQRTFNCFPFFITSFALYQGFSWMKSIKAESEQEEYSLEQIIADYRKNPREFIKRLTYDSALACCYAKIISDNFDAFIKSEKTLLIELFKNNSQNVEQMKDILIESMGRYFKNNFTTIMTGHLDVQLLSQYFNFLREKSYTLENDRSFDKEIAAMSDLFMNSLPLIVGQALNENIGDFLFHIVPVLETTLLKKYGHVLKKEFKERYCKLLVAACNRKNSFSLYKVIKLFLKCNNAEHELIYVHELFKQFNNLESIYYLNLVETKKAQHLAIDYIASNFQAVACQPEIINTLNYWIIYSDPSLARPLATEHCMSILQRLGCKDILCSIIKAVPAAQALIDTSKVL
jgi:hypothetical protein